jgi:hypothetical protein
MPVIHGRRLLAVVTSPVLVLPLLACGLDVMFVFCSGFRGSRAGIDPAVFAVIAHVIYGGAVDYGRLVRVMDADIYVIDRSVVVEIVASPVSAGVTDAGVTEAVVDAAVEAHVGPPITGVPNICACSRAPISRRPEHADRSADPRTRHPVVVVVTVGPIAWSPNVTRSRANRLGVNGQCGRSNTDRHSDRDLCARLGRDGQSRECN